MKIIKRLFDVVGALFLLVLLSPVLVILIILVRFKLGKPALFLQKRPGLNGKIFTIYKFRSMTDQRDAKGHLLSDDKRLTDFGRFLRSSSLDELPELINILNGSMSFVGPRPQLVRDMVFFDETQMRRQSVLPGLTGWAQVNGRNEISWEDKFKFDLEYVDGRSLLFDLKILYLTIGKVFKREGIQSYGMATAEDYGDYLLHAGQIPVEFYNRKIGEAELLLQKESEEI